MPRSIANASTIVAVLLATIPSWASIPDLNLSHAEMPNLPAEAPTVVVYHLPDGTGGRYDEARGLAGETYDATVVLTLLDAGGAPIANYPFEDLYLIPTDTNSDDSFYSCASGTAADANTDVAGQTRWQSSSLAGGYTDPAADVTRVFVSGMPLNGSDLNLQFNSADLNADLEVNLEDLEIFATDYFGDYRFRSDFEMRWCDQSGRCERVRPRLRYGVPLAGFATPYRSGPNAGERSMPHDSIPIGRRPSLPSSVVLAIMSTALVLVALGTPITSGIATASDATASPAATGWADTLSAVARLHNRDMALIPGGSFEMGADVEDDHKPVHTVSVRAFYLDTHEVTNREYEEFCTDSGHALPQFWGLEAFRLGSAWPDHPVVCVTWKDAADYAAWRGGRLPTEAEWEFAARGGLAAKKWPWGDEAAPEQANYWKSEGTKPVGSYAANGFGLYDMAGNVGEWVFDWYDLEYYSSSPAQDPTGPDEGKYRVVRGGGWHSGPYCNRVYRRIGLLQYWVDFNTGFRCARDADRTPADLDDE